MIDFLLQENSFIFHRKEKCLILLQKIKVLSGFSEEMLLLLGWVLAKINFLSVRFSSNKLNLSKKAISSKQMNIYWLNVYF